MVATNLKLINFENYWVELDIQFFDQSIHVSLCVYETCAWYEWVGLWFSCLLMGSFCLPCPTVIC